MQITIGDKVQCGVAVVEVVKIGHTFKNGRTNLSVLGADGNSRIWLVKLKNVKKV